MWVSIWSMAAALIPVGEVVEIWGCELGRHLIKRLFPSNLAVYLTQIAQYSPIVD